MWSCAHFDAGGIAGRVLARPWNPSLESWPAFHYARGTVSSRCRLSGPGGASPKVYRQGCSHLCFAHILTPRGGGLQSTRWAELNSRTENEKQRTATKLVLYQSSMAIAVLQPAPSLNKHDYSLPPLRQFPQSLLTRGAIMNPKRTHRAVRKRYWRLEFAQLNHDEPDRHDPAAFVDSLASLPLARVSRRAGNSGSGPLHSRVHDRRPRRLPGTQARADYND